MEYWKYLWTMAEFEPNNHIRRGGRDDITRFPILEFPYLEFGVALSSWAELVEALSKGIS
jgi:hypothetical protein